MSVAGNRMGLVVAFVAVVGGGFFGIRELRQDLVTIGVGSRAPDFAAATLDSVPRTKTMADYSGNVVLLNVWATWCAPCRVEMPSIQNLHEAYASRGLKVWR